MSLEHQLSPENALHATNIYDQLCYNGIKKMKFYRYRTFDDRPSFEDILHPLDEIDCDKLKSICDLVEEQEACMLLLLTGFYPHWVCICRNKDSVVYFDSVGNEPPHWNCLRGYGDFCKYEYSAATYFKLLGRDPPEWIKEHKLVSLLRNIPEGIKFQYNTVCYQKGDDKILTCGKWCTVFAVYFLSGRSLDQFEKYMKMIQRMCPDKTYDELVCYLYLK